MPAAKLKEFLDTHSVRYVTINHSPAFTAQEIAASAHIPGKELAKTVIIKLDDTMAMAVLPAGYGVNLDLLKITAGAEFAALATESEFRALFPDCEAGAMPPFGNLYGMKVFVEQALTQDKYIAFNAGTHRELVRLAYKDFDKLVKPTVARFA